MIQFQLNNTNITFTGDPDISLLSWLRNSEGITSVKDGCSGQGACGACLVEINGKPKLSCTTKMRTLEGSEVLTMEGIPPKTREILGGAFVEKGAVQCGFCSPGFIMRTKILLQQNPEPSLEEIRQALRLNLCRCTGYKKIEEAIQFSSRIMQGKDQLKDNPLRTSTGEFYPKYEAYETAIGKRRFVNDLNFPQMCYGALKFSDYPRAEILKIDMADAAAYPGVIRVFTVKDIPGSVNTGLICNDWPLMIAEGGITHYIGDVLAAVVAETEEIAREAIKRIKVTYQILPAVTDPHTALKPDSPRVHKDHDNLLDTCLLNRGDADAELESSAYTAHGVFETQRVEHAFLETESAVAMPEGDGILLYSSGQGIYEDRRQVASLLDLPEEQVRVVLVPNGGGFGGKEDITVQGHAALFAWHLQRPVKVTLSRDESIRMHPKRHPVWMDITLGCNAEGKLTALKLKAVGDTGAYASVGTKVMERIAGHASAGYFIPSIHIESLTVYTNNIPSGAMRGFGANQVNFALEGCIDELCSKGNFDRWKFRYDNALIDGLPTCTGDKVKAAGIRACLLALKGQFYENRFTGLACGIKNSGIGNGMIDFSDVIIEIVSTEKVIIHHGWTEMGQGIHTVAIQVLCRETGIDPAIIEVKTDTAAGIKTGMTTSSRATVLLGNAIIEACKEIRKDIEISGLEKLAGKKYHARWVCDWTTKPGQAGVDPVTHYSYGYAAQLAVLDEQGNLKTIYAAHDAGKIINPVLFEGQVQGAVHMGTGYALSEDLPMKDGYLQSTKLLDCGVLRAHETPDIVVIPVEVPDPVGPYGAKGLGEIGLVPTASAIANAFCYFDGIRRYKLPIKREP